MASNSPKPGDRPTQSAFRTGDIVEVVLRHANAVGPRVYLRIQWVDGLGIGGPVYEGDEPFPSGPDSVDDSAYLDAGDTHPTLFAWSAIESVWHIDADGTYDRTWAPVRRLARAARHNGGSK